MHAMFILDRIMAGLIPQTFIDDLLTRIDIIDVIDGYVPLKKAGRNYQASCPFHEEKTPSFTVSPEKQFYHCFGCGANGTAITFLMEHAGMDFVEAVEDLAARVGLEVPRETGISPKDSGVTELYELMEMVIRFYCKQLREHPDAQRAINYLKGRGISGQLAAEYELGFAPPGWDSLINALGGSNAALIRLSKAGMIIERDSGGGYYDRFRDRIIFPIRDQRGRAIGMGGRVLGDDTPKYLNSPETPIFHKGHELYGLYQARRNVKDPERIFVVEGYMDVLALVQHGVHNAVATLGTAFTPEHMDRLFKVTSQVVFCFDGDTAGQKAAWRAMEVSLPLIRDGRQVFFMFMPEGEDPDTFVRKNGPEQFKDRSTFVPLTDFLMNTLRIDIDLKTREGKALLAEKSIPYLARIPSITLQQLLLNDIATQCQVGVEVLNQLLQENQLKQVKKEKNFSRQILTNRSGRTNRTGEAIQLLLYQPQIGLDPALLERLNNISGSGVEFLLELLGFIHDHPDITCAGILEHWRDTRFGPRLQELAAREHPLLSDEVSVAEKDIKQEFMDYISKIEKDYRKLERDSIRKSLSNPDDLRKLQDPSQSK